MHPVTILRKGIVVVMPQLDQLKTLPVSLLSPPVEPSERDQQNHKHPLKRTHPKDSFEANYTGITHENLQKIPFT
jgi:hypothetical protein